MVSTPEVAPVAAVLRRRLPAEQRRQVIVAAARKLFARNGFHATGTTDIAAAAGCSEPVLYKHFASKQALFAAVLDDACIGLADYLDVSIDGDDDPFLAYTTAIKHAVTTPRFVEIQRLRTLAVTLADEPEIREMLERNRARMRARIVGAVRASQERGSIRTDVSAEDVATIWSGLGFAAGFAHALGGDDALLEMVPVVDTVTRLLSPHVPEGGRP